MLSVFPFIAIAPSAKTTAEGRIHPLLFSQYLRVAETVVRLARKVLTQVLSKKTLVPDGKGRGFVSRQLRQSPETMGSNS